ncbi:hypothetical protein GCM10028783_41530 [Modestobacter muralis]
MGLLTGVHVLGGAQLGDLVDQHTEADLGQHVGGGVRELHAGQRGLAPWSWSPPRTSARLRVSLGMDRTMRCATIPSERVRHRLLFSHVGALARRLWCRTLIGGD